MAAAIVQTKTVANVAASPATVVLGNTTAGNTLIVAVVTSSGTTAGEIPVTGITNGGDTFTKILSKVETTQAGTVDLWYAANIASRTTPTLSVAFDSTGGNASVICREYSGLTTTPLDKSAGAISATATTAVSSGATAVTTSANELVIGAIADDVLSGQTYTPGTGFGNLVNVVGGGSYNITMEDKTVAATGAQTATVTLGTATEWEAIVATFVIAGGGATPAPHNLMMLGCGS